MAIFNKSDQQTDYASNITTLAAGASFTGTLEIKCSIHIDGEFNGDINSTNTVEIGKLGVLKGELKAKKLVVTGRFLGTADCDSIALLSGGKVEGKLITASLAVDADGSFQGESVRKKPSAGGDTTVVDFAESDSLKSEISGDKKSAH